MVLLQAKAGEYILAGVTANDATQYVDTATQQIVDKWPLGGTPNKTTAAADGVDLVVIGNLPNPTQAVIAGPGVYETAEVTDGTLELTFHEPGEYRVRLSSLHRLDQEVVINAH